MNWKQTRHLLCAAALATVSSTAAAGIAEVRAQFRPDPSNTMVNHFKNITPSTGYCAWFAYICVPNGWFSLNLPVGSISTGPVAARHSDPRKGAFFKAPSDWRSVTVTNDAGDSAELEVRISGIGGSTAHGGNVVEITGGGGYEELWSTGRWHKGAPPCTGPGALNGTSYYVQWAWQVPEHAGACASQALFNLPLLSNYSMSFGYELRAPNPLAMPSGLYRGRQLYTVGPGMDFDFGDISVPSDDTFLLDFILDVDHILKVEVPPGGRRVQLEPQGGWQAWLQNGRKPTRLFRDQTVNLWASSAFKMTMECGEPMGNTCSVRNAAGHQVPLEVAVTLPGGLADAVGRPVNRLPLRLDGAGTERFQPTYYIDRKPSTLHFEIQADSVSQMLEQAGSTYSGEVTVVWDSQV